MKILAGTHGTGKTRSLLLTAEKTGGKPIIYCKNPLKLRQIAHDLGVQNVAIKDYTDFWQDTPHDEEHWFVDDISSCLQFNRLPIEGFTLNID